MRLSADLIAQAVPHVNPIREWELQLRGCTIPAIENTGTTKVRCRGAALFCNVGTCSRDLVCPNRVA